MWHRFFLDVTGDDEVAGCDEFCCALVDGFGAMPIATDEDEPVGAVVVVGFELFECLDQADVVFCWVFET